MSREAVGLVAMAGFVAIVCTIFAIAACYDRIIVALMRHLHIPACPEAVGIAMLIYQHPQEWTCGPHRMHHPKVGDIWTANEAYGLHVETDFGRWNPNKIERRIIRDAVDWRLKTYVRNRIGQALNAGLVTGKVTDG